MSGVWGGGVLKVGCDRRKVGERGKRGEAYQNVGDVAEILQDRAMLWCRIEQSDGGFYSSMPENVGIDEESATPYATRVGAMATLFGCGGIPACQRALAPCL